MATNMHRENAQLSERTAGIVEEIIISPSAVIQRKEVQLLEKRSDSEDEEAPIFVDSIKDGQTASADEWIAHMDVNGTDGSLKLDTGAQVNILPMKDFQRLRKKPKVCDKKVNLKTYDYKTIPTKGVCRVSLSCNGIKKDVFVLVKGNKQAIHIQCTASCHCLQQCYFPPFITIRLNGECIKFKTLFESFPTSIHLVNGWNSSSLIISPGTMY